MKVVILTEGGRNIGFGHVTRCIALYQAFKEFRLKPQLFINGDSSLKTILARGRIKIFDWLTDVSKTSKLLEGTDIAIIDSYLVGLDFLKKIVPMVKIPVYIDDYNRLDYPPGVIINPNIHGRSIQYPIMRKRKYILGLEYALLRKEFWNTLKKRSRNKTITVTVSLGGQDIRMLTLPILKILVQHYPHIQKIIIVNSPVRNLAQLKRLNDIKTKIIVNADARSFKNILAISDIAISGAGQTTNELARMGVPTIAICLAKNQEYILKGWQKRGFLLSAGTWNDKDLLYSVKGNLDVLLKNRSLRLQKSLVGRQTIDGKGALRVTRKLKAMASYGVDFREPSKILFLTNNPISNALITWLRNKAKEKVKVFGKALTKEILQKYSPDFVISYNYRYIIKKEMLDMLNGRFLNLHIAYLPWNRGAHPNVWSFLDGTPKGVTIHLIDAGIDSGDILLQKRVNINKEKETLASSYAILHREIQSLFMSNWERIKKKQIIPRPPTGKGSIHSVKDFIKIEPLLDNKGWNIRISDLKKKFKELAQ